MKDLNTNPIIVLLITIFFWAIPHPVFSDVGRLDEAPPEEVKIDPIDWFIDRSFRYPSDGRAACEQVYNARGNKTHCKFGVALYCGIAGKDLSACAAECDSVKSRWGQALEQCHYGCLAAKKYSC